MVFRSSWRGFQTFVGCHLIRFETEYFLGVGALDIVDVGMGFTWRIPAATRGDLNRLFSGALFTFEQRVLLVPHHSLSWECVGPALVVTLSHEASLWVSGSLPSKGRSLGSDCLELYFICFKITFNLFIAIVCVRRFCLDLFNNRIKLSLDLGFMILIFQLITFYSYKRRNNNLLRNRNLLRWYFLFFWCKDNSIRVSFRARWRPCILVALFRFSCYSRVIFKVSRRSCAHSVVLNETDWLESWWPLLS